MRFVLWGSSESRAERADRNAADPCEPDLGNSSGGSLVVCDNIKDRLLNLRGRSF